MSSKHETWIHEGTFFVEGAPVPQGSKSVSRTGHMYEANKKLKPWREKITAAAKNTGIKIPTATPCKLVLRFFMPRGKSVRREHMSVKPDLDKLTRAVGDALTKSGIYDDDARVIHIEARKEYAKGRAGVEIEVRTLEAV